MLGFNVALHYTVRYAFEKPDPDNILPEDEKYGYGVIPIQTDIVPETPEEWMEIAGSIGRDKGYKTVGIIAIEDNNDGKEDIGEFVVGEIVDDK